jgi:thiol:disulfide interchange protein DsbC
MRVSLPGLLMAAIVGVSPFIPAASWAQTPAVAATVAPTAPVASPGRDDATLAQIKSAFQDRFPGIDVTAVNATAFSGLYEIQMGLDLLYTNAAVDYILQGSLIDAKKRVDLTAARLEKLTAVSFDSLPLASAIKQVKGTGARQMAIFEDPNCGYCKQLHKTLEHVDDITVYTFLFPILSTDSELKARNIWCAKDQAQAWRDWMIGNKVPATAECETPVEELLALGRKMMVQGTPAIIFADGSRVNGALPVAALKERLDALN